MEEILSPEQWNQLQIILKLKYPQLSDDDLQYHESPEADLLQMVGYSLKVDVKNLQRVFAGREHSSIYDRLLMRGRFLQSGKREKRGLTTGIILDQMKGNIF